MVTLARVNEDERSLSFRLGQGIKQFGVPAAAAVGGTIADVATIVPRSIQHVGSNIAAGFRGAPPNNDFTANPITQSLLGATTPPSPVTAPTATPADAAAVWQTIPESQKGAALAGLDAQFPDTTPTPGEVVDFLSGGGAASQQQGFRPAGPVPTGSVPPTPAGIAPQQRGFEDVLTARGLSPEASDPEVVAQAFADSTGISRFNTLPDGTEVINPAWKQAFDSKVTELGVGPEAAVTPQQTPLQEQGFRQAPQQPAFTEFSVGTGLPAGIEGPLSSKLFGGTPEEFTAASQALTARNAQRFRGAELANTIRTGAAGIRKDVAQAGLFEAQAEAEPITAASAAGLRTAQAEVAGTAKLLKFTEEVSTGFDKLGVANPPRKVQKFFDPATQTVIDPLSGAAQRPTMVTAAAARNELPEAKRSIVDKHFSNTKPTAEEVMSFISTLE